MTHAVARVLFPFTLVVAIGIWAKGYAEVGDGFSGGAIAGMGAVALYVCLDHKHASRVVRARWAWHLVVIGLILALAVALAPVFFGVAPVTHAPAPNAHVYEIGIIELHTAVLFDLGIMLLVYGMFVGTFDRLFPILRGDEK